MPLGLVHPPVARELAPARLRSSRKNSRRGIPDTTRVDGLEPLRDPAGASSLTTEGYAGFRLFAESGFLRKMPAFRHTSRISRHGHSHGQPEQTAKAPSPSGR
ncbi:hypothetical protein EMIT0P100_210058 [Pseudomonas sp. IT-P100]